MSRMWGGIGVLIAVGAWTCVHATPDLKLPDYLALQDGRYSVDRVKLPEGGLTLSKDVARFRLESGSFQPMQRVQGRVTGFVFSGKGRLRLHVPDTFEQAQLKRFAHDQNLRSIDTPFSDLVVRTVDELPPEIAESLPAEARFARHALAYSRTEDWAIHWSLDVDARIVAGLRIPDDGYFVADVKTADFGWLRFEFEPWKGEEITLGQFEPTMTIPEIWVSLDQATERDAAGRPTSVPAPIVDVKHIDIKADLADHRAELLVGFFGSARPDPIKFKSRVSMTVVRDGVRAFPFEFSERAELAAVRDASGADVPFLRDPFGKRRASIANERSTRTLVVLVDLPPIAGDTLALEFEYKMRTMNYVVGREWYPMPPDSLNDLHTARLTAKGREELEVRAAGRPESEMVVNGERTSVWVADIPAKMFGFAFGAGFREETIKLEGAPEVIVFGTQTGGSFGNMVRNVAVDVSRSAKFYQDYLGVPMRSPYLRATAITGWHGQAFDGLMHMAQGSFNGEHPGSSELFRAHETAHQYWGHIVGWKSYRDQWLSEGFANYFAMMYIETILPKAEYFDEIVNAYTGDQLGSMIAATSKYSWGDAVLQQPTMRQELGPIAAGYRASTTKLPIGYALQAYEKGALVLHTLRTVLSSASREQDVFRLIMQDFVKEYAGRPASTQDFQDLLERKVPFAWGPFFQAYVYQTEIPAFAWSWSAEKAGEAYELVVTVQASDVPPGFKLPIPLAFVLGDGKTRFTFVLMEGSSKTFRIPVPAKPSKVVLNPNNGVLASIRKLR